MKGRVSTPREIKTNWKEENKVRRKKSGKEENKNGRKKWR